MSLIKKSTLSAIVGLLALSTFVSTAVKAETNPFASQDLMTIVSDKDAESKCGEGMADKKADKKGKCGEGKCGEGKAAKKGKCGEGMADKKGKCGEGMADKKGKCGEGMAAKKSKCGEGKTEKKSKCGG